MLFRTFFSVQTSGYLVLNRWPVFFFFSQSLMRRVLMRMSRLERERKRDLRWAKRREALCAPVEVEMGKTQKVVPRIELGSPESESDVITATLYNRLLVVGGILQKATQELCVVE
jgi:hypothetical protein